MGRMLWPIVLWVALATGVSGQPAERLSDGVALKIGERRLELRVCRDDIVRVVCASPGPFFARRSLVPARVTGEDTFHVQAEFEPSPGEALYGLGAKFGDLREPVHVPAGNLYDARCGSSEATSTTAPIGPSSRSTSCATGSSASSSCRRLPPSGTHRHWAGRARSPTTVTG